MKKLISAAIILSLLAFALPGAALADNETDVTTLPAQLPFSDVELTHWAFTYIIQLYEAGITQGYPDGTFKPRGEMTRAEWALFLFRAADLTADADPEAEYEDLSNDPDDWRSEAAYAVMGLMDDFTPDGALIFRPGDPATREDVAVSLVKLLGTDWTEPQADTLDRFTDKDDISEGKQDYVAISVEMQIFEGDPEGTFRPKGTLNRQETAALLYRTFLADPGGDYGEENEDEDEENEGEGEENGYGENVHTPPDGAEILSEFGMNFLIEGSVGTVILEQNSSTGYAWHISISDEDIIERGSDYVIEEPEPGLVGAPSVMGWDFIGVSPGVATITFKLIRSWEPDDPVDEIEFQVTVVTAEVQG